MVGDCAIRTLFLVQAACDSMEYSLWSFIYDRACIRVYSTAEEWLKIWSVDQLS